MITTSPLSCGALFLIAAAINEVLYDLVQYPFSHSLHRFGHHVYRFIGVAEPLQHFLFVFLHHLALIFEYLLHHLHCAFFLISVKCFGSEPRLRLCLACIDRARATISRPLCLGQPCAHYPRAGPRQCMWSSCKLHCPPPMHCSGRAPSLLRCWRGRLLHGPCIVLEHTVPILTRRDVGHRISQLASFW